MTVGAGFYEGEFGAGLVGLGRGHFSADDLRRGQADWVESLSVEAWDHRIWTIPRPARGTSRWRQHGSPPACPCLRTPAIRGGPTCSSRPP